MSKALLFYEVVEATDRLTEDEQHELIRMLKHRLAEAGRARVIANVRESQQEYARGECRAVTVDELMREILEDS